MEAYNTDYLRPLKAESLKKIYAEFRKKDKLKVESYSEACFLPIVYNGKHDNVLFGNGGVIDSNGDYIELSGTDNVYNYGYDVDSCECSDKKVVYCGYCFSMWGEFITHSLSRLWYSLKNDESVDYYAFIVEAGRNRTLHGNFMRVFELLGIDEKVILINKPTKFREVVIPEDSFMWRSWYADEYNQLLDKIIEKALENSSIEGKNRIFLSRAQFAASKNMDAGIAILDSFAANNDMEIIAPENVLLDDLIALMNSADEIYAPSGTIAHNFLFIKNDPKLFIFDRFPNNNTFQTEINLIRKLNITYIDADYYVFLVRHGPGPSLIGYTDCFKRFVDDNNFNPPDAEYNSESWKRKSLRQYMKVYKKNYYYSMFIPGWMQTDIAIFAEANEETMKVYGTYLDGIEPFSAKQIFESRIIKNELKKSDLLKKIYRKIRY